MLYIAVLAAGFASHVVYFRRGEHHMYAALYVQIVLATVVLGVFALRQSSQSFSQSLSCVTRVVATYLIGVYTSTAIYRLLFHPLRRFPGPVGAKLSSLWTCSQLRKGDAYRQIQTLHNQYGDIVRVGSSDLSIAHPEAVNVIYGANSRCTRAAWYDLTWPMVSLQTYRVKSLHDKRRRQWSAAFSDKALRDYEKRIKRYQGLLSKTIESSDGEPIDIAKLFNLYTFDVMGDLAFSKSFNMLETQEEHWAITLLNRGIEPLSLMLPVWLFRVLTAIPGLTRDWWRFINYCSDRVEERRQITPATDDFMTTLLKPFDKREPTKDELLLLRGDSQLLIVAGSDTTSATLTFAILELCRSPEHIQKLRNELAPYSSHIGSSSLHQSIFKLDHLNAVIQETLRLHPPVPTALQRKTPPEGIFIDGKHIPGNMTVWSPQYVMGRKEEIYTHAEQFLPERWYLYEDMVKDRSAWAPFSTGPFGCIGRPLAMMNLRTTLARLVMEFDFCFPASTTDGGAQFENDTTEHFTLCPAKLEVSFKRRAN